jgi:hypothetical protein
MLPSLAAHHQCTTNYAYEWTVHQRLLVPYLVKGQVTCHEHVQDDAHGPHVRGSTIVSLVVQHLWRHVVGSATRRVQQLAVTRTTQHSAETWRGGREVRGKQERA